MAYLDDNVGAMLDALEELGLDDSTLVVYVSDHGYLLDHHRRFEKHMMWEEVVRVPMIVRHPGLEPRTESALVELVDVTPTILEVLGAPPMDGQNGRSLRGLLPGETSEHRDIVFSEYFHDNKAMVRTKKWKYIFTTGKQDLSLGYETGLGPSGRDQRLYNMRDDPNEFTDLADDVDSADVIRDMQARMLEIFQRTHPRASDLPSELSVDEQLEWFLEPPEEHLSPADFLAKD